MLTVVTCIYFLVSIALIIGLKRMSSPKTARNGIILAGWAMLAAILATFFLPSMDHFHNFILMIIAMALGGIIAWFSGKKVQMIHIPQMIALYNGMGGGAAGAIAALELMYVHPLPVRILAVLGAMIGGLSFSGSIIAVVKLQEWLKRPHTLPLHTLVTAVLFVLMWVVAIVIMATPITPWLLIPLFVLILLLGVVFTLPIGGANMPVVISLFNAMTGLAVAFNGFALNNSALIIAGTVVGASGTMLTQLMAKAMNKSVLSIIFTGTTKTKVDTAATHGGDLKPIEISDAAVMLAYAKKVIIAPGYGMAVAQAQHKIQELTRLLEERGVTVKFAIHPVAGRMPGHMNVLLAESGIPYDKILDLDEVNPEFANTDVGLVIGANDVVNPAARHEVNSPIYGMPILDIAAAKQVLVIKRGQGKGFSGIENSLFTLDNVHMLYGDGQDVVNKLVQAVKAL